MKQDLLRVFWSDALCFGTMFVLCLILGFCGVGCDESDAPAVHGTIRVDASPLPPFEVQFRDESKELTPGVNDESMPSPTPVEVR